MEVVHEEQSKGGRRRQKRFTWFNPPWNDGVEINVVRIFLALVDKDFPKGSEVVRHLNRNTVKVSRNMVKVSYSNSTTLVVLSPASQQDGDWFRHQNGEGLHCNCWKPQDLPCKRNVIPLTLSIYKCTVTTAGGAQDYYGLTSNTFKQRFTNHKASFGHSTKAHSTSLSSNITYGNKRAKKNHFPSSGTLPAWPPPTAGRPSSRVQTPRRF